MVEPKQPESPDVVEGVAHWGLVALAVMALVGALLRIFVPALSAPGRLDEITLLYFAVAGGLLLARHVKTFRFGQLKLEMIERLREQQLEQEAKIADIALILPLLLQEKEVRHILALFKGQGAKYPWDDGLHEQLRRLRSIRLISNLPGQAIHDMQKDKQFNLASYVELTGLGRLWARRIEEIQGAETKKPAVG
jgi:hypothetical protein